MKSLFEKFFASKHSIYVWFLFLIVLCFGILIPKLGFYWDDLPYLYQYASFGPSGFPEYVASDRPFSAWIFMATTAIFKFNPVYYHILTLVLRWLCAILFFEIIQLIWKDNKRGNIFAASIFAVYPGFLQQPIALIYNHHFSVFAFFLLSVYLMVLNMQREKRSLALSIISILLSLGMFSIENFATLELIRPLMLWKVSRDKTDTDSKSETLLKILRTWIPYLIVLCVFVVWRVLILKFPTYKPSLLSNLSENPFAVIGELLKRVPFDFYTVTIGAWLNSFTFPSISEFGSSATYLHWSLVIITLAAVWIYFIFLSKSKKKKVESTNNEHVLEMIVAGLFLFICSGAIVWVLDLPLEIEFAWDRMTIAFLPSTALIVSGFAQFFRKKKYLYILIASIFISFAVGSHFQNSMSYKRDWENLENLITQFSWRAPSVKENTIFIASDVGLKYYSDNSLTSPLNLMYAEEPFSKQLSFFTYFTDARKDTWFTDNDYSHPYEKKYRSFFFEGNTSDIIAFYYQPPGCLKIFDQKFSNSITNPNLTFRQVSEIPFSSIDLILQEPQKHPYSKLFQAQSTDTWCYFFEKADLARQFGEYDEITRLGEEAILMNKVPRIASEWLPFLEGYIWKGEWERAEWIIQNIQNAEGNYNNGMCYTLQRIYNDVGFQYPAKLDELIQSYNCS